LISFFKFIFLLFIPFLLFADNKPKLLLLKVYHDQNITGWVMSEKLDGIRAYWDGQHLISRGGKIIHAPKWFLKDYPPFAIDGELWTKRGDFENISSIVRDKTASEDWKYIKHYIFEVPNAEGNLSKRLFKVQAYESSIIKIIPQYDIKNKADMKNFLNFVEQKGGEGIVVRDPKALYINKRTSKALKIKSFLDDECKVVGIKDGNGKFQNMMGSLECVLSDGTHFNIGSGFTKQERKHPPKVGEIVTFKYKEMTKYHKPRFPVFLRIRNDISKIK